MQIRDNLHEMSKPIFGDNLHEMSKPIFWEKVKYFNGSSAEIFTQHAES